MPNTAGQAGREAGAPGNSAEWDHAEVFVDHRGAARGQRLARGGTGRSRFLAALRAQHPNVEVIPISELDFGSAALSGVTHSPIRVRFH